MSASGKSRRTYTLEEKTRALTVLALSGDSYRQAARTLKEQGLPISEATLRSWSDKHPDIRQQVYTSNLARLQELEIMRQGDIANAAYEAVMSAIQLEADRIKRSNADGKGIRDAAATAKALATTMGIATDKKLILSGKPTTIVQDLTGEENIEKLRALGIFKSVDSTATELGPAVEIERGP